MTPRVPKVPELAGPLRVKVTLSGTAGTLLAQRAVRERRSLAGMCRVLLEEALVGPGGLPASPASGDAGLMAGTSPLPGSKSVQALDLGRVQPSVAPEGEALLEPDGFSAPPSGSKSALEASGREPSVGGAQPMGEARPSQSSVAPAVSGEPASRPEGSALSEPGDQTGPSDLSKVATPAPTGNPGAAPGSKSACPMNPPAGTRCKSCGKVHR